MRIIAGTAGRVAIKVPPSVARPTTDFVRQAMFSILAARVEGARVLDLFAGSGAVGLEALSRGAASCTFVDEHRQAIAAISDNLAKTRLAPGRVIRADARAFLRRDAATYDLIFADPPYCKREGDTDHAAALLGSGLLEPRLAADGMVIVETAAGQTPPNGCGLEPADHRHYGGTAILIYRKSRNRGNES